MLNGLAYQLRWRAGFLLGRNPYALRERLTFINPVGPRIALRDLVGRSLRQDRDGTPYFYLDGLRLYFRPEFPITNEAAFLESMLLILREAYQEPDYFSDHVDLARGDHVLDLGGSIGTCAMAFARRVGPAGKVFSFEPVTHALLSRNVRANGFRQIQVIPKGVSDRSSTAEISISDRCIDASVARVPGADGCALHRETIELTTVDEFVDEQGLDQVDFIKMDIEGAEELAIRGADRAIRRFRPKWSIASYHTDFCGEKQHPKLVRLLKEYGYQIEEVERDGRFVRIYAW